MGRHPNETGAEFRRRVLDKISPSFCAAKWLNASIWLGSGQTSSCHHPLPHRIALSDIKDNPSGLHNTFHKKLMRGQMLKGDRPKECDYCWRIEDMGPEFISDRIPKSDFYEDRELLALPNMGWQHNQIPRTLEIAFDRLCNFACAYCSPGYSSIWSADIKKGGGYRGLKSDGGGSYMNTGDWAEPFKPDQENPFVEAFFKWWPVLAQELMEIKITGGEPTSSPNFWRWLDQVQAGSQRRLPIISFNSNLGFSDAVCDRLLGKVSSIPKLGLYVSCEALGSTAEYIRDGLDFAQFERNLLKILESRRFERVIMMMTVNALSLSSFTGFMDWLMELKSKYSEWIPHASLTILRWPSFLSPLTLPRQQCLQAKAEIESWFSLERVQSGLLDSEKETVLRLISYLSEVDLPHHKASDLEVRQRDLKTFLVQYDQRRGKSYRKSLPTQLVQWLDSVDAADISKPAELINGNVADWYHSDANLEEIARDLKASPEIRP